MMNTKRSTVLGLALSVCAAAAMAQGGQASAQDKQFLTDAAQGSNFEIKTAQLALQKAKSDDVKQFAQKMIDDHTKLNEAMTPIAQQAGVTPPTDISAKDQALYDKLQAKDGGQFEKAYIRAMVNDHEKDLKAFKKEANDGPFPDEKKAAQDNEDLIKGHLMMAQKLATVHNVPLNGTGSGFNSSGL